MGRKVRNASSDDTVALLDLVSGQDLRMDLSASLHGLSNAIERPKTAFVHEDEWLLLLEDQATLVREGCAHFLNCSRSRREEVYNFLQSYELSARSSSQDVRKALACRSLTGSYRLQTQLDELMISEITALLGRHYVEYDFDSDTIDGDGVASNPYNKRIDTVLEEHEGSDGVDTIQEATTIMSGLHTTPGGELTRAGGRLDTDKLMMRANPLVNTENILDAVDLFLDPSKTDLPSGSTFFLVVGSQGGGKTYLCDEIARRSNLAIESAVQVLRPTLPIDFMGSSLGEAENTLISIFRFARTLPKCIILFDDIDRVLISEGGQEPSNSVSSGGEVQQRGLPHSQARLRSLFLAQLDSLQTPNSQACMLVIGTASRFVNDLTGRIDIVFALEAPSDSERRELMLSHFNVRGEDPALQTLLSDLVDCTVGRSRSEIVQYCRQAITSCIDETQNLVDDTRLLKAMKMSLQTLAPESLRTGIVGDFVDMKVLTARDILLRSHGGEVGPEQPKLPLLGNDARRAWKELEALIVVPLCQANALGRLLYGRVSTAGLGKVVCGGVLLTGERPGCGTSALAYHCASVAATLLPSVTLLDVSCTSLVHKELGGSERAVRHLFASARAAAPCILLMDGIENVAAVRGHDNTTEGTMDRILSTLLIELDGVDSQSSNPNGSAKIAVIGITHDESWVDSALRRPGRLEKVVNLRCPDYEARRQIVTRELQSLANDDARELPDFVASRTGGMSGAEVIALCREARMSCAREHLNQSTTTDDESCEHVTREHFSAAGLR